MLTTILAVLVVVNVAVLALLIALLRRNPATASNEVAVRLESRFAAATADMAGRLEQVKGDLRQQVTDRLADGFKDVRAAVDQQLANGRQEQSLRLDHFTAHMETKFETLRGGTETKLDHLTMRQAQSLADGRKELADVLALTTSQLKKELEAIRGQVDEKLLAIAGQVQDKLDKNIQEGFAHFTKVQEHLKAAEEQLRQVGALGNSINDLNNLLKLPHLRGKFGEASLERLLADFLPAHMYELQSAAGNGGRADAMIIFPDRRLPVDAKFPREQVLPLFESNDDAQIDAARVELVRVLKTEAKRIAAYIQPEEGTMDVALMYLPSETLYLEAIRSTEASDALSKLKVFPVSPNTLLMTLQVIALAYKWYEVAARFEETRQELARAQTSLGHFQKQFENLGKNLEKAQDAYDTASKHLKSYRGRVTALTGEAIPDAEPPKELAAKSGQ